MILERKQITISEYDPQKELARDAARLLGYHKLTTEPHAANLEKAINEVANGCFPLHNVRAYQQEAVEKAFLPEVKSAKRHNRNGFFICMAVFVVSLAVFVCGIIASPKWPVAERNAYAVMTVCTMAIGAVVMIISFCFLIAAGSTWFRRNLTNPYEWKVSPISYYGNDINAVPEFAIQTAVDIAKRCPDAVFYVSELVVNQRPDPFLFVKPHQTSDKEYYIEVWNEPGFKQKREI